MLKIITDVDVGLGVYEALLKAKFDVKSAILLDASMPDSDILSIANREERIVVTMDKDFGELVFQNKLAHHGVLLLRLDNATGEEKAIVALYIIREFGKQLTGKFSVYKNGRLRIRG